MCGCGKTTKIYRGIPNKYIHGHNSAGMNGPGYNNGTKTTTSGYKQIFLPDHPNAEKSGYVSIHIYVMTRKLGRFLKKGEVVHHIDENPNNNNPDNLQLFSSQAEHIRHHMKKDMTDRKCVICNGNKTWTDNKQYQHWYNHEDGGFICSYCYKKRNYKYIKKKDRK